MERRDVKKLVLIDIDGVVCEDKGCYSKRKVKWDNLEKIFKLMKKYRIKFWTARPKRVARATKIWLKNLGLEKIKVIFGKPRAYAYIDDKMKGLDEL